MADDVVSSPPHVLLFPLPLQGPINCTIKIGELLSLSGFHITLILTDHVHDRLLRHSDIESRLRCYPCFRLETLPDGLPEDHPRSAGDLSDLFRSLDTVTRPFFKDLLSSGRLSSDGTGPVTCVIADGSLSFTCDVADEVGIPIIYVRTISPSCLWILFCAHRLIESGEFLFEGNDLDKPIKSVPALETVLRRRDLPSFFRDGKPDDPAIKIYLSESREVPRARGLILNSFQELEEPILSQIRTLCPNLYNIGPIHAHLNANLPKTSSSNSLLGEDDSCIPWLDNQPPGSVVYVSFGSLAAIDGDDLLEFWHGLANSGKRFLWVIREGAAALLSGEIPAELREATEERGHIVGWAPQERVLGHKAVCAFWTHGGWNAVMEGISEGVPLMCSPFFLDQQINSRVVGEVWKVGLDVKDLWERTRIEEVIREVVDVRRNEFVESCRSLAELIRTSVREGGSSYSDFQRLVDDIKSMV